MVDSFVSDEYPILNGQNFIADQIIKYILHAEVSLKIFDISLKFLVVFNSNVALGTNARLKPDKEAWLYNILSRYKFLTKLLGRFS